MVEALPRNRAEKASQPELDVVKVVEPRVESRELERTR